MTDAADMPPPTAAAPACRASHRTASWLRFDCTARSEHEDEYSSRKRRSRKLSATKATHFQLPVPCILSFSGRMRSSLWTHAIMCTHGVHRSIIRLICAHGVPSWSHEYVTPHPCSLQVNARLKSSVPWYESPAHAPIVRVREGNISAQHD